MTKLELLIAEDDALFQKILIQVLGSEYNVIIANDGQQAWEILKRPKAPRLAILDWVMPGLSGPQVCRNVRSDASLSSMYLIILTAKNNEADIVSGLRAGADDYITKPFITAELRARVRVGERVLALQEDLKEQSFCASQASRRESLLRKSLADCSLRNKFCTTVENPGMAESSPVDPSICCPVTGAETGVSVDQLLLRTLEESNSKH